MNCLDINLRLLSLPLNETSVGHVLIRATELVKPKTVKDNEY